MYQKSFHHRRFGNRNSRGSSRHLPKPIHPSLFVNKASLEQPQAQYTAKHMFSNFPIAEALKRNIAQKGYLRPTPIQDQVIPLILEGKDVIGIANTGTGKTGAFLIPLINKVHNNSTQKVLIIAPTRELALQIEEECNALSKSMNIFTVATIGGASIYAQTSALRRSPHFVVGTPGRLKDLLENRKLNLYVFNNIVLDEVDRMMDMGFINDIKFLLAKLPTNRQSLFFSATIPAQVAPLMQTFLKNPLTISVKTQETAEAVEQNVIKLNGRNKIDVLHDLLAQDDLKKVLVFGRTKWGMEKLAKILLQRGFRVAAIHGNKSQGQRQRALEQFKNSQLQVLVATDVASRGLDIDNVTHVINYDQPASYEDYIHRIGRTGRADKRGIALTFID